MTQSVINFPVPASQLAVTVNDNVGVSLQQDGDILNINPLVPPPDPTITSVTVSGPSTLNQGATAQYTAKVTGTGDFDPSVTWKCSDGTISATGLFTAPKTTETVIVSAVSVQDPTKSGSMPVAIANSGNTVQFQASGGDDTSALQTALNATASAGKILELNTKGGTFHVNPLTIPSGTQLLIDPGVLITDQSAYPTQKCMFNINTSNVTITATGAFAQMPLSLAQSEKDGQEYRHCVVIGQGSAASGVSITGLSVTEAGGDGLYIRNSSNVSVSNFKTSKNYRNGCSITGVVNGLTLSNFTSSGNQRAGIDFEPNANTDYLMNIVLNNAETDTNGGGGMSFGPYNLDGSSKPVSITVNGFASNNDNGYGIFFTNDNDKETGSYPPGLITVNNAVVTSSAFGGAYGRFAAGGLQIVFNNLSVHNSNVKGTDPHYQMSAAVGVELNGGQAGVPGNVTFNIGSISNTGKGMQNYFQIGSGAKNTTFKATGSLSGATNTAAKTVYP